MAGSYYWVWSNKTGFTSNDNSYATAPTVVGVWKNQDLLAPAGMNTWNSQCTFVLTVRGTEATTYVYWGDRWNPGDNSKATYVWQPMVITGARIALPTFLASWKIDVTKGTWSP